MAKAQAEEYSRFMLYIYDYVVLLFISKFVWRCPTSKVTLPLFQQNVSSRHLDIGVGTGYFTKHGNLPAMGQLTLADLNQNCLGMAKNRLGRPDIDCQLVQHDIFQPFPNNVGPFDSISMFYLLHCLPGPTSRKVAVFSHLKHKLAPDGVIVGANILGERRHHTWLSNIWVHRTNKRHFMDNLGDTEAEFVEGLRKHFAEVETRVIGSIFLFKARKPIM